MNEGSGFLIAFGIACGALLSAYQAKKYNHDPEIIYYLFLPLTIWGLIGARLWHIFTPPLSSVQLGLTTQHYLSHPIDALALWTGGFGIPGAILGGVIALYIFCRKYEQSFWELADILAPGILLAQIIGRLTNYFNQELYGLPTNGFLKIFIDPAHRLLGYEAIEFYHPLFAYEMILNTIYLILLLWLSQKYGVPEPAPANKAGTLFLIYLVIYSITRFGLEFLRLDSSLINGVNINQVFFIFLFIFAGGFLLWRNRFVQNL
ncbi:MAG: prolipoprotein diacylglyceryl transferase [Anaerolineales bacterium]|nr:prolipoprotein diacylglyceryl transferase [Anaerolineales bacterium]